MSKDNNTAMKVISVINALLVLICAAGCVYVCTSGSGTYFIVSAVVEFLALVFSVLYYVFGFRKDAAKFYKLFMLFYASTYLVELLAAIIGKSELSVLTDASTTIIFSMILYGNTLLLAVSKDLGKKASLGLCIAGVVCYALPLAGCAVPGFMPFDTPVLWLSCLILFASHFVLALNALIMTLAKYKDKEMRGTK